MRQSFGEWWGVCKKESIFDGTDKEYVAKVAYGVGYRHGQATPQETFVADVRKFAEAAGHTTDEFNVRQTALYIGLQLEEMAEKLEAIFDSKDELIKIFKSESHAFKSRCYDHAVLNANRMGLLDADVDLAWVTIGSMLSQGADVTGAMNEVVRSNMSKMVEGRMVKDANGKVVKPDTYSPPNLAPFVKG